MLWLATSLPDALVWIAPDTAGALRLLGFIIPVTTETQGYLNFKSYWEFANQNRPDGWNAWVTFVISPAEQTPSTSPRRMSTK